MPSFTEYGKCSSIIDTFLIIYFVKFGFTICSVSVTKESVLPGYTFYFLDIFAQ